MVIDESRLSAQAVGEFESALEDVLLRAFARGVEIEGTWRFESPVADAPGWEVGVTRIETEKDRRYDASLIED